MCTPRLERLGLVTCALSLAAVLGGSAAAAQSEDAGVTAGPHGSHYDLNVYPALTGDSGIYDLNVASSQAGPAGTIALTNAAPPKDYSFQDMVANTHGYVSAGISSRNGHSFDAGVSIPIVAGKAELELGASTGQFGGYPVFANGGKSPVTTYDAYNVGLALHPADNVEAFIGVTGVKLHASGLGVYPYAVPGVTAFPNP